jgi:threonine dehydratase
MAISREEIAQVYARIQPYIRRTPVVRVDLADFGLDAHPVDCKLEFLQHAGSFKTRGAFANLLTRAVPPAGVIAASGGNHGAAVAYAAHRLGIPAHIFVPSVSSPAKQERIRGFGAKLIVGGALFADAHAASREFAKDHDVLEVHPFDQHETLLGQGSVGLELEEQCPDCDTLLVAVGGGGLIGGIAAWYAGRVKIIAVEPHTAPTLHAALAAGKPVDAPAGGIAADSLAPKRVGEMMFPYAQQYIDRVVLVEDDAIREAQRALWRVMRVASEPGGATAMAALLSGAYKPQPNEKVAVLLCGANTDAVSL